MQLANGVLNSVANARNARKAKRSRSWRSRGDWDPAMRTDRFALVRAGEDPVLGAVALAVRLAGFNGPSSLTLDRARGVALAGG